MADWSGPALTTAYLTVLPNLKDRDVDAVTFCKVSPSNPPDGAMRFNRTSNSFEEYSTATGLWAAKVLAIAGGGTGAITAAAARTALGLGDLSLQNANAVAITGGSLNNLSALGINANLIFGTHNTYDIGTKTVMARNTFAASGAVAPVGVDKWVAA